MGAIKDDILALRTLIAPLLPVATKFHLQDVPESPVAGSLAIRLTNQTTSEVTIATTRVERLYQLIYFGKTNIDVIDVADILRKVITKQVKLAIGAEHITLGAFAMSQPFKTESGVNAAIFVLPVSFMEHRERPDVPKMEDIRIITEPEREDVTIRVPIQLPCSPLDTLNLTKDIAINEATPVYTAPYQRVNDDVTTGESSI